jgi:hypothetical protein
MSFRVVPERYHFTLGGGADNRWNPTGWIRPQEDFRRPSRRSSSYGKAESLRLLCAERTGALAASWMSNAALDTI